jgi:hypothetical protein
LLSFTLHCSQKAGVQFCIKQEGYWNVVSAVVH